MAKMSTKKAIIGAVIVMVVWFAIWGVALNYLRKQTNMASNRGFIEKSVTFIETDESFAQTYGELNEVTPEGEAPIQNETAPTKEYYMDFTCQTATGTHRVRVFRYWNAEKETWLMRYEALPIKC